MVPSSSETISISSRRDNCLAGCFAGGPVCFLDISEQNFHVCNPLTGSSREIPAISKPVEALFRGAVGMVAFDWVKDLWIRRCPGSNMPSYIKLPLSFNFSSPAISVDNTLYIMVSDPDGIVSYDTVTGTWKQLAIPALHLLCECVLAECKGRIMLVGLLAKKCSIVCRRMGTAEIDAIVEGGGQNAEPMVLYDKRVRMTCLSNKDLLMLSLSVSDINRLVTYDLENREWHKVPGCSVACRRSRLQWIVSGAPFHPSPTAMA